MDTTTAVLDTVACESDSLNALASVLYARAINLRHCDMGFTVVVVGSVACASDSLNALAFGLYMRAINLLPCDMRYCSKVSQLIPSQCCADRHGDSSLAYAHDSANVLTAAFYMHLLVM